MYIELTPNIGECLADTIKTAEHISTILKVNVKFKFNKKLIVIKYKGCNNGEN